ncbi:MAG: cupin domain-containing protein [Eubacteriales bacterium]|jgi:ethanolamine utilization protein EutQ|nr:cupin domain-containing protein [Eubacteriales bacterium]
MEIDEKVLSEVIAKVVEATLNKDNGVKTITEENGTVKHVDPSGIMSINFDNTRLDEFNAKGVTLQDLTTVEESPAMGPGVMEIDHSELEWTLTYDEYDYVISGELTIEIDGRHVVGKAGETILIPKGSHIHFQSLDQKTRYIYYCYPANWSDFI